MNSCGIKIMIYVSVYWQKKTCPVCVRDSKSHPLLRASVSRKCFQISILFLQILIVHCIRCPKQSIVKLKTHFVFLTQWSLLVVSIGESLIYESFKVDYYDFGCIIHYYTKFGGNRICSLGAHWKRRETQIGVYIYRD